MIDAYIEPAVQFIIVLNSKLKPFKTETHRNLFDQTISRLIFKFLFVIM